MSAIQAPQVVKRTRNAALLDSGEIRLQGVRTSYAHLWQPYAKGLDDEGKPAKPAYSCTFLLPKSTHQDAYDMVMEDIQRLLGELRVKALADDKYCLRDGDRSGKEEYAGFWTLSAREQRQPVLLAPSTQVLHEGQFVTVGGREKRCEDLIYSGCWVNGIVNLWPQNNPKYGKRINANLRAVQFVRDDAAFGQGPISVERVQGAFEAAEDPTYGASINTGGL